jgi:hypothetical protein
MSRKKTKYVCVQGWDIWWSHHPKVVYVPSKIMCVAASRLVSPIVRILSEVLGVKHKAVSTHQMVALLALELLMLF